MMLNDLRPWQGYEDNDDKIEFSGPLLSKSYGVDELLERHERQIRQLVRKSWFQKGKNMMLIANKKKRLFYD